MGVPTRFSDVDRVLLLQTLLDILRSSDVLTYNIAWNIPDLLLPYFDQHFDFDHQSLADTPFIKLLLATFSHIAEKGNPKELNLKALETLSRLSVIANYNEIHQKSPKVKNEDSEGGYEEGDKDEEGEGEGEEYDYFDNDDSDDDTGNPFFDDQFNYSKSDFESRARVAERFLDLKFVALFETISTTLKRITTSYPSRFLATATTGLLSFFASNVPRLSLHGLVFVVRRLYLFVRDYNPLLNDSVTEMEKELLRKLLQSFITFLFEILFSTTSVKWSHRLYVELRNNVALEIQQIKRERFYVLQNYTFQINDLSERIEQLGMSIDMDVNSLFKELVSDLVEKYDKNNLSLPDTLNTVSDDTASETSTIRPDSLPFDFQGAKAPENVHLSKEGILLFVTQVRFENRHNPESPAFKSFQDLIKVTHEFILGSASPYSLQGDNESETAAIPSSGVCDALAFWALWTLRNVKSTQQLLHQVPSEKMLIEYLQLLTMMAVHINPDREGDLKALLYSVILRILSLHTHAMRYGYLVDTIKSCPFSESKQMAIRHLKDFLVAKKLTQHNKSAQSNTVDGESLLDEKLKKLDINDEKTQHHATSFNPDLVVRPNLLVEQDQSEESCEKLSAEENEEVATLISLAIKSATEISSRQFQDQEKGEDDGVSLHSGNEEEDEEEEIDFSVLGAWANFVAAGALTQSITNQVASKFDTFVNHLKDLCKDGSEVDEDEFLLLRQAELLELLVGSIKRE